MEPRRPRDREDDEQRAPASPLEENEKTATEIEREGGIDENRRAAEIEEVVGPQPGGGEESGHS